MSSDKALIEMAILELEAALAHLKEYKDGHKDKYIVLSADVFIKLATDYIAETTYMKDQ